MWPHKHVAHGRTIGQCVATATSDGVRIEHKPSGTVWIKRMQTLPAARRGLQYLTDHEADMRPSWLRQNGYRTQEEWKQLDALI